LALFFPEGSAVEIAMPEMRWRRQGGLTAAKLCGASDVVGPDLETEPRKCTLSQLTPIKDSLHPFNNDSAASSTFGVITGDNLPSDDVLHNHRAAATVAVSYSIIIIIIGKHSGTVEAEYLPVLKDLDMSSEAFLLLKAWLLYPRK